MKIEKLIQIFEKCIPTYQKCVDENWDYDMISDNTLYSGLCLFIWKKSYSQKYSMISNVFKTYYIDFIKCCYLFTPANEVKRGKEIEISIKPRLKFLKQQVKELKKLQKQGYTHV